MIARRLSSVSGLFAYLAARGGAGVMRNPVPRPATSCGTPASPSWEAGMALEAIPAQAGHASIESTRLCLHLASDWLAREYLRAAPAIDAQGRPGGPGGSRVTRSPRRAEVEELAAAYRADLRAAGMFAEHPVTSPARSFLTCVGVDGWPKLSLAEQCATSLTHRRVVGWLMVTRPLRPAPDYLVLGRAYLGEVAARHHAAFFAAFTATAAGLGFDKRSTAVLVADQVQVQAVGDGGVDELEEVQELLVALPAGSAGRSPSRWRHPGPPTSWSCHAGVMSAYA
jgi:hypothetical protein